MNPWTATDNFQGGVKVYYDNLLNHLTRFRNPIFVETGTYMGNGLKTALRAGFVKCYSIEIHEYLYLQAYRRFAGEVAAGVVNLHWGDSQTVLPGIVQQLNAPATFWLDAHLSQVYGEQLSKNCPILEELAAIGHSEIRNHTILIDDVMAFGQQDHDWITLDQVKHQIRSINPAYEFELLHAEAPNNILAAWVP